MLLYVVIFQFYNLFYFHFLVKTSDMFRSDGSVVLIEIFLNIFWFPAHET